MSFDEAFNQSPDIREKLRQELSIQLTVTQWMWL